MCCALGKHLYHDYNTVVYIMKKVVTLLCKIIVVLINKIIVELFYCK